MGPVTYSATSPYSFERMSRMCCPVCRIQMTIFSCAGSEVREEGAVGGWGRGWFWVAEEHPLETLALAICESEGSPLRSNRALWQLQTSLPDR